MEWMRMQLLENVIEGVCSVGLCVMSWKTRGISSWYRHSIRCRRPKMMEVEQAEPLSLVFVPYLMYITPEIDLLHMNETLKSHSETWDYTVRHDTN